MKKTKESIIEFDVAYLKYLNISEEEYPEEYERYKNNNIINFEDTNILKFKKDWY